MSNARVGGKAIASESTSLPDRTSATLFLEDTVQIQLPGGEPIIGVIAKTWHDLDEQDIGSEIDETIPGAKASPADLKSFVKTGTPPRPFYYFTPSAPDNCPVLVHESECTLLDRAFAFGDAVKRSLTSPHAGTVISIETRIELRPAFIDRTDTTGLSQAGVKGVLESELVFVNEWNIGDFVVYKNCWMGVLDDVFEEVTIKLSNGSVVSVYDPGELKIPISGDFTGDGNGSPSTTAPTQTGGRKANSTKLKVLTPPAQLSPGQTVVVSRPNLWRGRWIYGAYDPSINPIGVVVDVKTVSLDVHWLCQNMMVTGRFIPVERPPSRLVWDEEEMPNLIKFKKSVGGVVDLQGNPFTTVRQLASGGDLQVGDRVKFADLDAAVEKYRGAVKKIPRSEMLGFDVNTFVVVRTNMKVRVLWQDMTETIEDCKSLVPYLNVDEHEVWPGEIVVIKPDMAAVEEKTAGTAEMQRSRERFEGVWDAWTSATGTPPGGGEEKPEFMRPKKVGVVQSVNPTDRIAGVKWFASPNVDLAGGFMIPGSTTGPVQPVAEDVSLYDAVAHQALSIRRGDFVLIVPDRPAQVERPTPVAPSPPPQVSDSSASTVAAPEPPVELNSTQIAHVNQFVDSIRGMVDGGLLANLSAALGNHTHPQLQAVSRYLNQFPGLLNTPHALPGAPAPPPAPDAANVFTNEPCEWLGEVVDLGLDGLITVRLGALGEPRDVKVPIERLHVIFNEDMDLNDGEFSDEDYDETDDDEDASDDDDDGMEYVGMDEPEPIEEKIIYEGGERLDNGGEEDWLTDDEDFEDESEDGMPGLEPAIKSLPTEKAEEVASSAEPVPRTPPPIPENAPAPEAIQFAPGAPSRFLVLDTEIPSDHAYRSQPATARTPAVARRIAKEQKILASSLPEGIFVRTWESRLDLLRVLIVGPLNTPYELAPFVFDFHFTSQFPTHPPVGYFHSWTSGIGRVNPNLYEDGKICLSLLGTWHAEKRGEGWSASGSSVLQLLVSLMGLVLVREPWYNEAGFGVYQGAEEVALNSHLYSEKAYILARGFVKHVLQTPVKGCEDIINWLYLPNKPGEPVDSGEELGPGPFLLKAVVEKACEVVRRSESEEAIAVEDTTDGVGRVSRGALALLKRHLSVLETILEEKMGAMEGVEQH